MRHVINVFTLLNNKAMISKKTPHKLSRRKWLRSAAVTATGAVALPSIFISCNDTDDALPKLGRAPPPLTHEEFKRAAANLINMNKWVTDLYILTGNYENTVLHSLLGGTKPQDWKDFELSIFTQIAVAFFQVAFKVAASSLGPFIGPVFAVVDALIKQFAVGSAPPSLFEAFADFEKSHLEMQKAISDKLLNLAEPGPNKDYQAMQDAFKDGDLEFDGKKYTLQDLANSKFPFVDSNRPDESNPAEYVKLRTAAYDQFRRHVWNLMIVKAGYMNYYHWGAVEAGFNTGGANGWARQNFYNDDNYKAAYLRGFYNGPFDTYNFYYWIFEFDGVPLSADAAEELFIDTTPGYIINPDEGSF